MQNCLKLKRLFHQNSFSDGQAILNSGLVSLRQKIFSGTTWMRAIVVNLLHKDNEVGLKILTKDSPWLTFLEGKLRK